MSTEPSTLMKTVRKVGAIPYQRLLCGRGLRLRGGRARMAGLLADRPVSGRKRAAQMRRDANWRILYALYQVGIPANSICTLKGEGAKPAASSHWPQGIPLWRCEMFNSQDFRRLFLAAAAAGLLTVAGCSNQATDQATNQLPAPPKKALASKPVASKTGAAKPPVKKPEPGKVVAAKGQGPPARPVAVSSKVGPQP